MSQPSGDTNNRNIIVEKERDTAKELVPTEIVSFSQHKEVLRDNLQKKRVNLGTLALKGGRGQKKINFFP